MRALPANEHQIAKALVEWWELNARRFACDPDELAAVPNGGDRHPAVAGKMKAEGVRKGFPDYVLLVPREPFHGLAIELKTERGQLSKDQRRWIQRLAKRGYSAHVCKGLDAAIEAIEGYLKPVTPRLNGREADESHRSTAQA